MNEYVKKSYNTIVNQIINNSKFVRSTKKIEDYNNRELKWKELVDAIYVLGPKDGFEHFKQDAEYQGFLSIVNFLEVKMIQDLRKTHSEDCKVILDWIEKENGDGEYELKEYEFYVFGCHISHVIISMDMIQNNYKRVLVFENDSKFYDYFSNYNIQKLINFFSKDEENKIGFLNMGFPVTRIDDVTEVKDDEVSLYQDQTKTTHTYIINQDTAKKLIKTIDTDIDAPKKLYKDNNIKEYLYRCGADEYFYNYVKNYCFYIPYTFQQSIGNNRSQDFNYKKK